MASHRSRGNALFLILIAVALFAALSYAITQSSRGGGSSAKKETDTIVAAQIMQVTASLRAAVTRVRLSGVPAASVKFHTNADMLAACTLTDGTCIFTPEGGGGTFPVAGKDIPMAAYDAAIFGTVPAVVFQEVDEGNTATGNPPAVVVGIGSPAPDGAFAMIGVAKSVCEAINRGLGISPMLVIDPTAFAANMPAHSTVDFGGKREGCIDMTPMFGNEVYEYFAVILEN